MNTLPTARSAVRDGEQYFGYPTLVCGNFNIGFSPSSECSCPLRISRSDFMNFKSRMEICTSNFYSYHGNSYYYK